MKNSIIWKFFGAFVFLVFVAVIVLHFFVSLKLQALFEQRMSHELHSNAVLVGELITPLLQQNDLKSVQDKTISLSRSLKLRITVIAPDGTVLADSEKPPSQMPNHKDRTEIAEALKDHSSQSTRYSDTLDYYMKYVAVRIDTEEKPLAVVRFSLPLSQVQLQQRLIYRNVLTGGIVAVLVALVIAYLISKSITSPIARMQKTAEKIAAGDLTTRTKVKSNDELGRLACSLNAMADQLQLKIENLNKLNTIRTDFVANVSHELKTPLTLIKGYVETLKDGAIKEPEKASRFIEIIEKHTQRLQNITNDLLDLSELELSKTSLEKSKFDLLQLLNEIKTGFAHTLAKDNKTLSITVPADFDPAITADRDKIEKLFVNLIDNAIKYTNPTGRIEISILENAGSLEISVADNGIGISPEHIDRVFERFYRADKARSRQMGGTGLGLGLAKHIVIAHNGKISLKSQLDKGTTVTVTLPKK